MSKHYIIPIFIPHIGCPNMCVFCNQNRITGQIKTVSQQDIFNTVNEYLETIKNPETVELAFFGGSFTGINIDYQKELLGAGKKLIDEGKIQYIRISTRPDYINEEILTMLKQYGVKVIELGVQSMDEEVLNASKRGHSPQHVVEASRLIREHGFILGHQMMIGLPKDSYQKSIKTALDLISLKPDIIRIYPVLVIKDTELEEMLDKGEYESVDLNNAVEWCKDILMLFEDNNIKVIRVGLQATDSICEDGDVIAGPWHSSFRELVESKIFLDMLKHLFEVSKININSDIYIFSNPKDNSKIIGNNRSNITELINIYKTRKLHIENDKSLDIGTVKITNDEKETKMSKTFFIKDEVKRRNFMEDIELLNNPK